MKRPENIILWTELPNGYEWHLSRLKGTLESDGAAFGCLADDILIGYATVDKEIMGKQENMCC